ncbi:hypothetical protein [Pontibacter sp. G13]|uniref:hypothetical protein n=1 Tax=Pontibacter sp. G13 TaxID=3074898 RepID=UPI00288BC74C|nr:hypothetical protein [Pontibacter sp. G13]WNJ17988.1 hypothetical protein RJD25_24295 [Pontibacter sp. G13]
MDLYKIISQLTDEEFTDILNQFIANKADKSASFLDIIRKNPETPDKEFLQKHDITPSAFYVLKSRLNQKIETFLLNRLGDPNLHVMRRVLNVNDLIFNNPREISVAALRKLEKELLKFDFPYGLMIVYKELQNLHAFDENHTYYKSRYNQQVAYAVAMDKAIDLVVQFFRVFDEYYLSRKDRDHAEMIRIMEKIDNVNNLYESHRLYILKAIIHIFAKLFIDIPDTIRCELEDSEAMFERSFEILSEYKDDAFYSNINLLFNFLRFVYYDNNNIRDKSNMYFDLLDYKVEELLTRYHLNVNTSMFLFHKMQYHKRTNTIDQLIRDVDTYISQIEVETYRMAFFVNFHMFQAQAHFFDKNFKKAARILYNLRNEVNLRKKIHFDLEVRFMLALTYVLMEDFDLANQSILALQRQLRKPSMERYQNNRVLLRILSVALGGKPKTRSKNLRMQIEKWKEISKERFSLLKDIDMEEIFLQEESSTLKI